MVILHCESNTILAEPIKNRTQEKLSVALARIHTHLKKQGFIVKLHVLDNEAPPMLTDYLDLEEIPYQKAPQCSSPKRCRKSNPHLQKSFHRGPGISTKGIPIEFMVSPHPASIDHP